jgi:hypothetical protein
MSLFTSTITNSLPHGLKKPLKAYDLYQPHFGERGRKRVLSPEEERVRMHRAMKDYEDEMERRRSEEPEGA